MGSSPTPPAVADPNQVSANQQALNTQAGQSSQQGSMVNQSNPYANISYSQTGTSADGTPLYTASQSLSQPQQQLLNYQQGGQTAAGQQAQTLWQNANYGSQNPADAVGNATTGLTQQAMAQQTAYLQPQFTQDTNVMDTKLRNQGLAPGEPGYDTAMNALKQSQGQTMTGYLSSIEPQMYQQAQSQYLLPAQLATALSQYASPQTGSQLQTPGLTIQPANLIGATANAQQAQQQTYQDQLQQNNAMMSGLFGIPTALLGGWAASGGLSSAAAAAPALLAAL